jgi:HAD superfamily hydrolase (TIGR01509 family)
LTIEGIIFDFDGVIADSEALANLVLAETVTGLGLPTSLDDSLNRYMGKRAAEVAAAVELGIGRPLPDNFSDTLATATLERFRTELKEVKGAQQFILRFAAIPCCIASSSSMQRLSFCLDILGLAHHFSGNVFSSELVARGKPHPDIFLYAAGQLNLAPATCLVIEDSVSGVHAGVAAGMTVLGLCAGSHLRGNHAARMHEAGAAHVSDTWADAEHWVSMLT